MSTQPRPAGAAAPTARALVRQAWKATLATLLPDSGHPYGSLVALATETDGTPLLLLSGLAVHTKNIKSDQKVSLLVDATAAGREALTGARVTLVGTIAPTQSPSARRRYLARHPNAKHFIDFDDFDLYALHVGWAHLVAGFGRIERLTRGDVILATAGAESLMEGEASIIAHMNDDHPESLSMIAASNEAVAGSPAPEFSGNQTSWTMTGCDPEGFDLARGDDALRVPFPHRVNTPEEVRSALFDMATTARNRPR